MDQLLNLLISGFVHAWVVVLLAAILVANAYAIVHAWRSDRIGWVLVLTILFITGGGIATPIYLFVHYDEPTPRGA